MRLLFIVLTSLMPFAFSAQSQYAFSPIQSNQGLSEKRVRNINQLEDGRMSIITEGMISLYNGTSFKAISVDEEGLTPLSKYTGFHHSYIEGKERLWLKNSGRLVIIDLLKERFETHPEKILYSMGVRDSLADMYLDASQNLWFLTQKDVLLYRDIRAATTRRFLTQVSHKGGISGALYDLAVNNQQVFLFYDSGLVICMDLKSGKELYRTRAYTQNEQDLYNQTLFVVQHKQNLLQLRNGKKGLMLNYDTRSRKWLKVLETDYWLNCVSVDNNDNIWVSCKDGLWFIDKTFKKRTFLPTLHLADGRDLNNEVSTVFNDNQGGLWVGTLNRGLLYYHSSRFIFKSLGKAFFHGFQGKELQINSFTENEHNQILVGTNLGYYKYSGDGRTLIPCASPSKSIPLITIKPKNTPAPDLVRQIIKWKQVYLGISGKQLFVYNPITRILSYPHKDQQKHPMFHQRNHEYNCLLADSRGLVWFGTQDGLYYWNENEQELKLISQQDGLQANSIRAITEDRHNNIWLTTSNGVARIALKKDQGKFNSNISTYNKFDGLIDNEFIERSAFITKDGRLLLGGIDGFNELNISASLVNSHPLNPIFSNFQLYGKSVNQDIGYDENVILKNSLTSTKELRLNYNQNFFTISFAGLNYINPAKTYFRYTLGGLDAAWQELPSSDGSGQATYTNLSPGTYLFKVQAADNNSNWSGNTAVLRIIIQPPFWSTAYARGIYLLLAVGILYWIFKVYSLKNRKKLLLIQKEKLDEAKFNFFTNLSHELRTPLTLIISPLEAILKKQQPGQLKEQLEGIHRNAGKLLQQVTQLLDFRKMEVSDEKLNLSFCDIPEYLAILCEPFRPLANDKLSFAISSQTSSLYAYLDKDKFSKIINNLLSNAFKFTKQGSIQVSLREIRAADNDTSHLSIEVSDTGPGIQEEEQPQIFERFRQAANQPENNTGAGIGLYLVKEYVKIHQGDIQLESFPGKGSKFILTIPLNLGPEDKVDAAGILEIGTNKNLKVLIVEDNAEFRAFLSDELSHHYQVVEAVNGADGFQKSLSEEPDLIVTDLMMPGMNGLELCSALKANLRTSHIPLILLTARSAEDIQFEGYHAGADAFISKPFNTNILLIRISKLIEQQVHRRSQFKQSLVIQPHALTTSPADEKLMNRVIECMELNLSNCDYSVEQFSADMNMDRTGLYRKLLALTGLSPTLFIRTFRLKKAAWLLGQRELSISEIADNVGFKTVPYFSKCFQDEFGVKPSQFNKLPVKELS